MLLKISEQITECLTRAGQARERARAASDPEIEATYFDVERRWMMLADSFKFVEQADRFLNDAQINRAEAAQPARPKADNSHLTPICCETCGGNAPRMSCAPCTLSPGVREIWFFRCELFGEELKRIVDK